MMLRNLNIKNGLCNGTRLQIIELQSNVLKCRIISGDKGGKGVCIPRIILIDNSFEFTLKRHQFPVKLAFAITTNKAQGQTFDEVGIDLRCEVFGYGQLYVALSRVKAWSGVKVKLDKENKDRKVKNVVYAEILDN